MVALYVDRDFDFNLRVGKDTGDLQCSTKSG